MISNFLKQSRSSGLLLRPFASTKQFELLSPPDKKITNYNSAAKIKPGVGLVYTSGTMALDPKTYKPVGDIHLQAKTAMQNLQKALRHAGSDIDCIVKATIFLIDMKDYDVVNTEYRKWFEGTNFPARTCVAVSALPFGGAIEIEAVAVLKENK